MAETTIETLAPGLTREWTADHRAVIYTLQRPGANLIEAWADAVTATLAQWPTPQPYLALHDFSNVPLTLVERQVKNIFSARVWPVSRPDAAPLMPVPVRLALVMSFSLSGRFARVSATRDNVADVHKVFFKREPALEWLLGDSPA